MQYLALARARARYWNYCSLSFTCYVNGRAYTRSNPGSTTWEGEGYCHLWARYVQRGSSSPLDLIEAQPSCISSSYEASYWGICTLEDKLYRCQGLCRAVFLVLSTLPSSFSTALCWSAYDSYPPLTTKYDTTTEKILRTSDDAPSQIAAGCYGQCESSSDASVLFSSKYKRLLR